MQKPRVGIQGIAGSFHEMAALAYFDKEEIEIVACDTFAQQFSRLESGNCQRLVMAIENTIAGSILPNYALLERSDVTIIGEVFLAIHHCFMALPGQQEKDLKTVWSHPMALLQCEEFLNGRPGTIQVEKKDTATSAKEIAELQCKGVAAIGPASAAERYGLEIYQKNVETHARNFTRFLVLEKPQLPLDRSAVVNKASLVMHLEDRPGALAEVVNIFSVHGINLSKIQSLPIVGKPYRYSFHLDIEWMPGLNWMSVLNQIEEKVAFFRLLGVYAKGRRPEGW